MRRLGGRAFGSNLDRAGGGVAGADGIADLVKSANDEAESVAVIDELYRLAGIYNTCILCVLHFVPLKPSLFGRVIMI